MAITRGPKPPLPHSPIERVTGPLARFMHVEASSGVVLLACTVTALALANSPLKDAFLGLWKIEVGFRFGEFEMFHSLKHWINDALMAVFFFVIGLEVKRELVVGELRDARRAALPIAAALGGMVVPAGIYLALQGGTEATRGWGIPMATDIAFVVGCMAVLGSRIPKGLRVMLLSLAIADDIGAILVIAIGYTEQIHLQWLGVGALGIVLVTIFARLGVRSFGMYTLVGAVIWVAFHESGVHATIAGVILGLQTPARSYLSESSAGQWLRAVGDVLRGEDEPQIEGVVRHRTEHVRAVQKVAREAVSPLEYLESALHPWVGFAIMPIFALANAGVPFELADLGDPVAVAVAAGLVVGKPVGIVLFSAVAVKAGLARLPDGVGWGAVVGAGLLAGIGFTMALFIAALALQGELLDSAKVGILAGSTVAAALGMGLLLVTLKKPERVQPVEQAP